MSTQYAMTMRQIMTKPVTTVDPDGQLDRVREIFRSHRFHHLLVVESGVLVGVVSDRDLLKALSPNLGSIRETDRDTATLHKRVHQIMTRKPITLGPNAGTREAIGLFLEMNISCIPIVDEQFRPLGIVSWKDVLRAL